MPSKIYLAGPFFSSDQIARIQKVYTMLRQNVTVDQDGGIFVPMAHQNESLPFGSIVWQDATFRSDVRQIDRADAVVAVLDYKNEEQNFISDPGTMWEIGYAFAHNKPVIAVQFHDGEELNLMIAQSYTAFIDGSKIEGLKEYDFLDLPQIYTDRSVV